MVGPRRGPSVRYYHKQGKKMRRAGEGGREEGRGGEGGTYVPDHGLDALDELGIFLVGREGARADGSDDVVMIDGLLLRETGKKGGGTRREEGK